MQKKIIALAIATLSGAAFAQSNVTIYGAADATFESVKAAGSGAAATDHGSRSRVGSNSSFIGFKGSESLGNGLTAVFQFENGLTTENGAAGVWNNRDSMVALAGGFGTVAFGNLTGPTRAMGAKLDVNAGATGIGANTGLLGKLGGGSGASAFDQRITNAVAYISPNFSGFSGVIGYSTGLTNTVGAAAPVANLTTGAVTGLTNNALAGRENAAAGATVQGNTAWTAGLSYDQGPIYVGLAYTAVKATNNGAAAADGLLGLGNKFADTRLGGMYNFGVGTVGLLWDRVALTPVAGGNVKRSAWFIPVTFNMGAGKLIAQFGKAGNLTGTTNTGASQAVLGYEYALSKRTTLKAVYSQITNKAGANYDFLYGVSAGNSTATGAGVNAGADPKGYGFGIRHTF